jgi:glycosyltransferase involved in cell wall biosynthesis
MKSLPRVSALINNYNYARFLPEALNSALSQDYPNLEVVVVDDGSTDDSVQIINQYAERYPNKIVPVFKANGGQASAYNAGVERATGDIFCFLDSDDVWLPRKVRTVVRAHRQHAFVHHPVLKNGQPNFIPRQPEYDRQYLLQRFGFEYVISPSSGLSIRRDLASQIFPIPESGLEICADIFMRLAATYLGGIGTVPQPLTFYRIHGKNLWFSFERSTLEKTK